MTLPNALTFARIALIPLFGWLWCIGRHEEALIVFIVAGVSDLLDGLLARVLHQKTRLGAILDPAADKLMLLVSFLVAASLGAVPWWLAFIVIGRDVILSLGAALIAFVSHVQFDLDRFHPTRFGKYATFFQLTTIAVALLTEALAKGEPNGSPSGSPRLWVSSLVTITCLFTVTSGVQYVVGGLIAIFGASQASLPRPSPTPRSAA